MTIRCRPGGLLPEDRHVEVAVDGHRRGPRDRRGGHDEHVRHRSPTRLVLEGGPLLHAEAVLLVDHDHAEAVELDRLLDEGVGADEHVDLAGRQRRQHPLALLAGDAVGEQLDGEGPLAEQRRAVVGHADALQQRAHAGEVLLGEHLGGGHEGTLVPALHAR